MIYAVTSSNVNDKLLASFHEINIASLLLPLANVMFLGYVAILRIHIRDKFQLDDMIKISKQIFKIKLSTSHIFYIVLTFKYCPLGYKLRFG